MKEWLTYLSSDELQGRQVFTEGYGLATAYVADHLKAWGVKPLGNDGTYFETVKIKGYKATRNSSISVVVKGETQDVQARRSRDVPVQLWRKADARRSAAPSSSAMVSRPTFKAAT